MKLFKKKLETPEGKDGLTGDDVAKIVSAVIDEKIKKYNKAQEQREIYLLPEDIEGIMSEFNELEEQVRELENSTPETYVALMCRMIEGAIKTRVKDLSRQRETERIKEIETARARDKEQTPRYYRPFWRLFRLTPNRAMELINEREAQTARLIHLQQQIANDVLKQRADEEEHLYKEAAKSLEAETVSEELEEQSTEPADEQEMQEQPGTEEQPVEEPKRRRRRRTSERATAELNEIGQEVDDEQAFTQTSSGTTPPAQLSGQINEEVTVSEEVEEQSTEPADEQEMQEQPGTEEQPGEELKKRRRRRSSEQATAELNEIRQKVDTAQALTPTSSGTTPPAQLPGQINIEDIK